MQLEHVFKQYSEYLPIVRAIFENSESNTEQLAAQFDVNIRTAQRIVNVGVNSKHLYETLENSTYTFERHKTK